MGKRCPTGGVTICRGPDLSRHCDARVGGTTRGAARYLPSITPRRQTNRGRFRQEHFRKRLRSRTVTNGAKVYARTTMNGDAGLVSCLVDRVATRVRGSSRDLSQLVSNDVVCLAAAPHRCRWPRLRQG